MADEWVKFRKRLIKDPRVLVMSRACRVARPTILGALLVLWSLADEFLQEDGRLPGYTPEDIDREVELPGFCAALPSDWLELRNGEIHLPDYHEHNGDTARKRDQVRSRVRRHREAKSCNADVTLGNADVTTDAVTIPRPVRRYILARDQNTCVYCGWQLPLGKRAEGRERLLSIDHVVPRTKGGATAKENLVTACVRCNGQKSNRTPDQAGFLLDFLTPEAVADLALHERYMSVTRREKREERIEDPPNPPAGGTPAAPAERGDGKRQRKRTPDTMPPGDDLLAALVEVTASDPRAASSHLSRACKALREADPPYTASDVRALPEILRARGFTLPLTVGTVQKYIGWVRRPPAATASSGPSLDDLVRQAAQRRQALESSRGRQDDGPQPLSRLIPGLNGQATEGQEDKHAR